MKLQSSCLSQRKSWAVCTRVGWSSASRFLAQGQHSLDLCVCVCKILGEFMNRIIPPLVFYSALIRTARFACDDNFLFSHISPIGHRSFHLSTFSSSLQIFFTGSSQTIWLLLLTLGWVQLLYRTCVSVLVYVVAVPVCNVEYSSILLSKQQEKRVAYMLI